MHLLAVDAHTRNVFWCRHTAYPRTISAFALAGRLTSAFYLLQQGQKALQFCQFLATFHVGLSLADDNSVSSCRCHVTGLRVYSGCLSVSSSSFLSIPLLDCLLIFFFVYPSPSVSSSLSCRYAQVPLFVFA